MKFYQTKKFKETERDWNKKLEESGFEDIEKEVGGEKKLKNYSSGICKHENTKREIIEARREYYDKLNECFQKELFLEYEIISSYVHGKKRAEIHRELIASGHQVEYETVRFIIRRYEYKWGIKNYTLKQMNLRRHPTRY